MDEYIKYAKKCRLQKIVLYVLLIFSVVLLSIFNVIYDFPRIITVSVSLIFIIFSVFIYSVHSSKKIRRILLDECNPLKYFIVNDILNKRILSYTEILEFSFYSGRFKDAMIIAKKELEKSKLTAASLNIYYDIMMICFCVGDFNSCQNAASMLSALADKVKPPTDAENLFKYSVEYCVDFIQGNYEKCKNISELETLLPKASRIYKCQLKYLTALSYYYNGETDCAKKLFSEISNVCEYLFFSQKANEYLSAIENNIKLDLVLNDFSNINTEEKLSFYYKDAISSVKKRMLRSLIFLAAFLIILCICFLKVFLL